MAAQAATPPELPPKAHPASYWRETAAPALAVPRLSGDLQVDVAIVGDGFTGLSAAHHLQKAWIAAKDVGWGASGRNGCMLPPRYKKGIAAIAARYGLDRTRRLYALIHEAIDTVEKTVAEGGITFDFRRTGQFTAAHATQHLKALEADRDWMVRKAGQFHRAHPRSGRRLRRGRLTSACRRLARSARASLHPLNYSRGLAADLLRQGVPIFAETPVLRLVEGEDGVRLETEGGTARAGQAVFATNAYTDATGFATGALDRRIVAVNTWAVATEPLGDSVAASVLPGRRMVADTKHLMNWYRILPDKTVIFGGRGDLAGRNDGAETTRWSSGRSTRPSRRSALRITHRWSGKVAVTRDDFPHVGRLWPARHRSGEPPRQVSGAARARGRPSI